MASVIRVDGVDQGWRETALQRLQQFRGALFGCLGRRADELFELTDALLCADGPVSSLVGLCLTPEHRRGHGAPYDALNSGSVDAGRRRPGLAGGAAWWGGCRCRGCSAAGSCWPSPPLRGCARTPRPVPTGCSATSTAA